MKVGPQITKSFLYTYAPPSAVLSCPEISTFQASDFYSLWDAWERRIGQISDPPFWAVVWPAAVESCRFILNNPQEVRGKTVVDCGCGGAAVSIAAALCGAKLVVANDIDPIALAVAAHNAAINNVCIKTLQKDLTAASPQSNIDVIFAADMFYEKEPSGRMIGWFSRARENGTRIFVADGGRNFAPARGFEPLCVRDVEVNKQVEGCEKRTVRLLRMH